MNVLIKQVVRMRHTLLIILTVCLVLSFVDVGCAFMVPNQRSTISYKQQNFNNKDPESSLRNKNKVEVTSNGSTVTPLRFSIVQDVPSLVMSSSSFMNDISASIGREEAEALAGPFFGTSLFPYLGFLYFLNVEENNTPKGVVVGFAMCLVFVFLSIPAAIAAQLLYGAAFADSDWLHGSAESLLTITNLVTVLAFRQALSHQTQMTQQENFNLPPPKSVISYAPMINLSIFLTFLAFLTAAIPALTGATEYVHTPYLNGFMDIPSFSTEWGLRHAEPDNALTIAW